MSQDKADIVQRYIETLWGDKDVNIIDELFSPLAVIESPLLKAVGLSGKRSVSQTWFEAFPRGEAIIDKLISSHDMVVSTWRSGGIHENIFHGVEPTGKQMFFQGTSCYRFEGSKVVQYYATVNLSEIGKTNHSPNSIEAKTKGSLEIIQTLRNMNSAGLTYREVECLSLWALGFSSKKSAQLLSISVSTIEAHKSNIKSKLNIYSKSQLFEYLRAGGYFGLLSTFAHDRFGKIGL